MATSEENDLIGYDPLAWMKESEADNKEDHLVTEETDNGNILEEVACGGEVVMTDYSDDLIGNTEESAILSISEDESIMDDIEVENDSALVEKMTDDSVDVTSTLPKEGVLENVGVVVDDSIPEEMNGSLIDLDATLTIQNVVKLHEKLKDFLAIHDQIEINASDVSSIDTATLQLLVSLKKDAIKLQKKITIIYPSPRFVESAQLLGLLDVLEVDGV
jgi:anti-anti-sigma regulatory factor